MLLDTGLPVLVALAELGVIIWLWLSRRNDRRKIVELTLRARQELRAAPTFNEAFNDWPVRTREEQGSERTD